ncbi:MAG: hypothetical protein AVDCRST_MAG77-3444 [uncultured Chloroflexi bacterium]|uniref:Uncharacterized protein n=1 Tax=uncultured Chloroflexota bacterium TaxID=166587 RepID=A0A6J4JEB6_9CHLR|nr:MAG: hypothetical protein AVDCRST_MAG77-3444 [uncultured Chloroflexota bacterium]
MVLLGWLANALAVGAALIGAGMLLVLGGSFWAIALPLGVAGAVCVVAGGLRARQGAASGMERRCFECGAAVPEGVAVCRRCGSVTVGTGTRGAGRRSDAGRAMPVAAYSRDASGVIGWVDTAPPDGIAQEAEEAGRAWRRWAGVLLLGAGCFAALGTADTLASAAAALLVFAAGASAAAAAVWWRPRRPRS